MGLVTKINTIIPNQFPRGKPLTHLLEGYARRREHSLREQQPPSEPRFSLGQTVVTRTALAVLSALDIAGALYRHQRGDWGDVGREDGQANERALKQGERLLSVYRTTADGTKFWIITEHDRSLTTVLLPSGLLSQHRLASLR